MSKDKKEQASQPSWIERLVIRKMIKVTIKKIENMKGSWKTSLMGYATIVLVLATGLYNLLDGNPATVIDFQAIINAFAAVGILIPPAIGLIFSRDKDVSTEEQKAAKHK